MSCVRRAEEDIICNQARPVDLCANESVQKDTSKTESDANVFTGHFNVYQNCWKGGFVKMQQQLAKNNKVVHFLIRIFRFILKLASKA